MGVIRGWARGAKGATARSKPRQRAGMSVPNLAPVMAGMTGAIVITDG